MIKRTIQKIVALLFMSAKDRSITPSIVMQEDVAIIHYGVPSSQVQILLETEQRESC